MKTILDFETGLRAEWPVAIRNATATDAEGARVRDTSRIIVTWPGSRDVDYHCSRREADAAMDRAISRRRAP